MRAVDAIGTAPDPFLLDTNGRCNTPPRCHFCPRYMEPNPGRGPDWKCDHDHGTYAEDGENVHVSQSLALEDGDPPPTPRLIGTTMWWILAPQFTLAAYLLGGNIGHGPMAALVMGCACLVVGLLPE